jgi:hypothetical protein
MNAYNEAIGVTTQYKTSSPTNQTTPSADQTTSLSGNSSNSSMTSDFGSQILAQGIQQTGNVIMKLISGEKVSADDFIGDITSMGTNALKSLMTPQTT